MKKNDQFIGTCVGYTSEGLGIVRYNNFVFFVKNMLRAEEGNIVITSLKKRYGYGKCLQLIKQSEHRVEPSCSIYKNCGGCHIQHMDSFEQQFFKQNKVKDCFASIGHMEPSINEVLMMTNPLRYRNKVQVPVQFSDRLEMGFYRNHTHEIIEFEDCLVQTKLSNEIVRVCKTEIPKYRLETNFRHLLIKHAHNTNEVMIVFVVNRYPLNGVEELKDDLMKQFNEIKSVQVNINNRDDNVILSDTEVSLTKETMIKEMVQQFTFNISSKSFYQINPEQTQVLYDKALEYAGLSTKDTVIDLYCGTGTIGILASKHAAKVIGIEIIPQAIEDARKNALMNECDNIEFICADAKEGAKEILRRKLKINVVIVDPPRKGCDELTLNSIVQMNPEKIVYVSCDPSTLARDCARLKEMNYHLIEVTPVDMFPMTHHVECVCLMIRNG